MLHLAVDIYRVFRKKMLVFQFCPTTVVKNITEFYIFVGPFVAFILILVGNARNRK